MDTAPDLKFWWRFATILAFEVALILALAFAIEKLLSSAAWRRTVWQACLIALFATVIIEVSGTRRLLTPWIDSSPKAPQLEAPAPARYVVLTAVGSAETVESAPSAVQVVPAEPFAVAPPAKTSWRPGVVWLAGFAVLVACVLFIRLLLVLSRRKQRFLDDDELLNEVKGLAARLGIRRRVRISEIETLRGPVTFGLIRPTIAFPKDFTNTFTSKQRQVIVAHELSHVAAHDALWYALADFVTALLWWHPLIWWARQRLRTATEAAADEASVLIDDGPTFLAESLVQLGARLLQPQRLGLLGIEGFRSGLGRRVQRLLQLTGRRWRPPSRARSLVAKVAGSILIVTVTIICAAWISPPSASSDSEWTNSVARRALSALLANAKSEAPATAADADRADALITDGKIFFDAGKLDHAEGLFEEALKIDAENSVALQFLQMIADARKAKLAQGAPEISRITPLELERIVPLEQPAELNRIPFIGGAHSLGSIDRVRSNIISRFPRSKINSASEHFASSRTNFAHVSKRRRAIYASLDRIRLKSVSYDALPFPEVVKNLSEEARRHDPTGRGVDFLFSSSTPPIDPATGMPVDTSEWIDLAKLIIKVDPPLTDITLAQALEAIVKAADRPIKWSVEEPGVVFHPKLGGLPPLRTRWWRIDAIALLTLLPPPPPIDTLTPNWDFPNYVNESHRKFIIQTDIKNGELNLIPRLRQFLNTIGVDLSPPKAVFWKDRLGMLMVRATQEDLDIIDHLVQQFNLLPPSNLLFPDGP